MCCVLGTTSRKEACSGFQEDVSFSEVEREGERVFLSCTYWTNAWPDI